ncbi:hypothetical protein D9M70_511280 [compost metagenome]
MAVIMMLMVVVVVVVVVMAAATGMIVIMMLVHSRSFFIRHRLNTVTKAAHISGNPFQITAAIMVHGHHASRHRHGHIFHTRNPTHSGIDFRRTGSAIHAFHTKPVLFQNLVHDLPFSERP